MGGGGNSSGPGRELDRALERAADDGEFERMLQREMERLKGEPGEDAQPILKELARELQRAGLPDDEETSLVLRNLARDLDSMKGNNALRKASVEMMGQGLFTLGLRGFSGEALGRLMRFYGSDRFDSVMEQMIVRMGTLTMRGGKSENTVYIDPQVAQKDNRSDYERRKRLAAQIKEWQYLAAVQRNMGEKARKSRPSGDTKKVRRKVGSPASHT